MLIACTIFDCTNSRLRPRKSNKMASSKSSIECRHTQTDAFLWLYFSCAIKSNCDVFHWGTFCGCNRVKVKILSLSRNWIKCPAAMRQWALKKSLLSHSKACRMRCGIATISIRMRLPGACSDGVFPDLPLFGVFCGSPEIRIPTDPRTCKK